MSEVRTFKEIMTELDAACADMLKLLNAKSRISLIFNVFTAQKIEAKYSSLLNEARDKAGIPNSKDYWQSQSYFRTPEIEKLCPRYVEPTRGLHLCDELYLRVLMHKSNGGGVNNIERYVKLQERIWDERRIRSGKDSSLIESFNTTFKACRSFFDNEPAPVN